MKFLRGGGLILALAFSLAGQPLAAQEAKKKPPARPPAPVVVASVKMVREAPQGEYTGLIEPSQKVLLSSDVAGRLVKVLAKEGDKVRENQTLAVLRNSTLEQDLAVLKAQVRETEAQVVLSEQKQKRVESLYSKNLTSAQEYEDGKAQLGVIKAKLASDRVQVARLQDQLNRMTIRSPIDGEVISAALEVGQWITPNQPIFRIYNYDRFELQVGVPGRFLASVQDRGQVKVTVPELDKSLQGEIVGVVRHVERSTGNFLMRIGIDNPRQIPMSGLLAKVWLPLSEPTELITVPRDAVVRRGKRSHVVVVDEGKARIVPVELKGNRGDAVIVKSDGLKQDDQVVVRGNERLIPGMPVQIAGSLPVEKKGDL